MVSRSLLVLPAQGAAEQRQGNRSLTLPRTNATSMAAESRSYGLKSTCPRGLRLSVRTTAEPEPEADVITKIFGTIFGQKALQDTAPFGMKRMAEEEMHELYPATTTEFAAPVSGDSSEVSLFRPLLAKTRLEKRRLRCALSVLLCTFER